MTKQEPTGAAWTSIGRYTLADDIADGYAREDGERLAFTDTIDFNGHLPPDTTDYKFRFHFRHPGDEEWSVVTEEHLADRPYAYVRVLDGEDEETVVDLRPDPDDEGWILPPSDGRRIPTDQRVVVYPNTVESHRVSAPGPRRPIEKRCPPVPLHINNTPTYIRYDLEQLRSTDGSRIGWNDETGLELDHQWTVGHPYLDQLRVDLWRASDDWTATAAGGDADGDADGAGADQAVVTDRQTIVDPPEPSTYAARLQAKRRLTDGQSRVPPEDLRLTFCAHRE